MPKRLLIYRRVSLGAACVALAVLGAIGLYWSLPGQQPRDLLARRVEEGISRLPETEILPQLRLLADLGDAGMAVVVRLLRSRREGEARAAEVVLHEQLERWRRLPVEESAPRVMHLARELAVFDGPLPATRPRALRNLATQLTLWPTRDAAEATELLSLCEKMLAAPVERNSFRSTDAEGRATRTE